MTQATQQTESKALATIPEFTEFEKKLIEFKEKYDNIVYDLTDADQEKQAKSDRFVIGKVVSALDVEHKELKAPLKVQTDLIDKERKRIKDDLLAVQEKIKTQLQEHERKIQEYNEMLQDKVEYIRLYAEFTDQASAAKIAERLAQVKEIIVDESFEHRQADGTLAQVQVIKELETLHASQTIHEAEQAELARLRKEAADREQKDRDDALRLEGEERAHREAENKEKAEAEEKETQRVKYYESMIKHIKQCAHGFIGGEPQSFGILFYELEEKIVIDDSWGEFEAPAIEAKTKAISTLKGLQEKSRGKREEEEKQTTERAAQAERDRIADEQAKVDAEAAQVKQAEDARKANQEHRAKIHGEAKQALIDNDIPEDMAGKIVTLIKDGFVKNIQVNY